jgi:hypothetical protein
MKYLIPIVKAFCFMFLLYVNCEILKYDLKILSYPSDIAFFGGMVIVVLLLLCDGMIVYSRFKKYLSKDMDES